MPEPVHGPSRRYEPGEAIRREAHARPAARQAGAPPTRRLKVYTQDPATSRMEISTADATVPFEPLGWGPDGAVVKVIDSNRTTGELYVPLDLDGLGATAPAGLAPSTTDPRFAQQMTYAVAMATYDRFRQALGRTPDFAFGAERRGEPADRGGVKLHIYPHYMAEDNAYYDPERGALLFGYTFANKKAAGLNQPGGVIFTALSHDVVVHEMTHALLDGMRSHLMYPSHKDVDAFHEAFADLVALFQRFQFRELIVRAIADAPSDLSSRLLTDVARQWGQGTGDGRNPLRTALVEAGPLDKAVKPEHRYDAHDEAHDLGAVLVAAVYDAFRWIFTQKTARLRRLAAGTPAGSHELVELLASSACRIASQFLNIVIRAVDYCPPVDLTFGEFLRAMITADYDLVPEDPWGYREALVQAFRRYGITVEGVPDLSEQALLWHPPGIRLDAVPRLAFSGLGHGEDPGDMPAPEELRKRAEALGELATRRDHLEAFGLMEPKRGTIDLPRVESIRTLRRIGADSTVTFEQVAEIVQRRRIGEDLWFYGGSTVVIDAAGRVRYVVMKHVSSSGREKRFREHLKAFPDARDFFRDRPAAKGAHLRQLHEARRRRKRGST